MQNWQRVSEEIRQRFLAKKAQHPEHMLRKLELSWSSCFSGQEPLQQQARRLRANGLRFIELHGNHYMPAKGYRAAEVRSVLEAESIAVSGIVALSQPEFDLSSPDSAVRQAAIERMKRELEFASEVGAYFIDILPSALGRTETYDDGDQERCAASLRELVPFFGEAGVLGAIEPINGFEVGLVHSFSDAEALLKRVASPVIRYINGDLFHMHCAEDNVCRSILGAGDSLINLHIMDSNREAIGHGMYDLDTIIMALYLIGHNAPGRFVTGEPLSRSLSPKEAIGGLPSESMQNALVCDSVTYFRAREQAVLALA